ncbi:MAG: hypothetical protein L0Z68_02380 [Gammaproteobacteria bacterium]|nr:hypothetical protein [Gammaproteobacteria bacterium]
MKYSTTPPAIALALLIPLVASAGEFVLEVIPLHHRMTDEVVEILRPLVVPGGSITGMNNQIIVRTTATNLTQIKEVLQSIDRPPRRLLITVKQDIGGDLTGSESSLSGRVRSGDVTISTGDAGQSKEGLVISGKDGEGNVIRYRTLSTDSRADERNTQRVQTVEGQPALIQIGTSVPVAEHSTVTTGSGVVVQDTVSYRDVTSGFHVLPRLNGENVTLVITPQLSRFKSKAHGVIETQAIETTVSGRLGEWIALGGIAQQIDDQGRRNLTTDELQGRESRSVWVLVEELP